VKAFSPAGMAVKAFFGYGAKTFGNPDGALTGGGAYAAGGPNPMGPDQMGAANPYTPGPPPPAPSIGPFTNVGQVFGGPAVMAADGLGNVLAATVTNPPVIWKSTDGGRTWTNIATAQAQSRVPVNIPQFVYQAGNWVLGAPAGKVQLSDDMLTWELIATGITATTARATLPAAGSSPAMGAIAPGTADSAALSLTSGATWELANEFPDFNCANYLYGGSGGGETFLAANTAGQMAYSLDGVDWLTLAASIAPNFSAFDGFWFYAAAFGGTTVAVGHLYTTLATSAGVNLGTLLGLGSVTNIYANPAGIALYLDNSSPAKGAFNDNNTGWRIFNPNTTVNTNENAVVWDSAHACFIICDNEGNVSTSAT
jgi:hypothetical protein